MPTIVPPIQTTTANRLPKISHDLLFIRDAKLMLWNHTTNELEVLVGPEKSGLQGNVPIAFAAGPPPVGGVRSFSVSADGQKVAFVRWANANSQFEIALLDMNTRQITLLVPPVEQDMLGMSFSPNGKWVAYIPMGSLPTSGRGAGLAAPSVHPTTGGAYYGVINVVQTDAPDKRIEVGFCSQTFTSEYTWNCNGFLWSPDSRAIAWSDARGMWVSELGQPARQIVTSTLAMPNEQGRGVVRHQAWSPLGRYVLVWISHYEGSTQGIVDTQTGHLEVLPGSFEYPFPGPRAAWMQNGQLFVVRPGNEFNHSAPSGEIWHMNPKDSTLIRDTVFPIMAVGPDNSPQGLAQLADGQLAFAFLNTSPTDYVGRGLYVVSLSDLLPRKVNGLPPTTAGPSSNEQIVWAPSGTGALVQDQNSNALLYVPADGSPLYDLNPVIGGAFGFTWIK
jgi:hypothetical protein